MARLVKELRPLFDSAAAGNYPSRSVIFPFAATNASVQDSGSYGEAMQRRNENE